MGLCDWLSARSHIAEVSASYVHSDTSKDCGNQGGYGCVSSHNIPIGLGTPLLVILSCQDNINIPGPKGDLRQNFCRPDIQRMTPYTLRVYLTICV